MTSNPTRGRRRSSTSWRQRALPLSKHRSLHMEPLEDRHLLTSVVSLGNVVHPTEGFGFGSTIEGLDDALTFDGTNHYVNVSISSSLKLREHGQFTQEAWIFSDINDDGLHGIFSSPKLWITNKTGIRVGAPDGSASAAFTVQNVLNSNVWNHVATTFDGTDYKLFVNGVELRSTTAFAGRQPIEPTDLQIGRVPGEGGLFKGAIDEVRIWNVARTGAEIQGAMLETPLGDEEELVGYWKFSPAGTGELELPVIEDAILDRELGQQNTARVMGTKDPVTGVQTHPPVYINNPAPQIGYVDVHVSPPVEGQLGLWVKYDIESSSSATAKYPAIGGAGIEPADFLSSRYRRVSTQVGTETNGIIIAQGETQGRIYFSALPDAIAEGDEEINISLATRTRQDPNRDPDCFIDTNCDYTVANGSATIIVKDNQLYQPGAVALDKDGRPVTTDNKLFFDGNPSGTVFGVKLTSEPEGAVTVLLNTSAGALDKAQMTFNSSNWDSPQVVRLRNTSQEAISADGTITIQGDSRDYLSAAQIVPFTIVPPTDVKVGEGRLEDRLPVTPVVSVVNVGNTNESDVQPALVAINLSVPAPEGGLDVNYDFVSRSPLPSELGESFFNPIMLGEIDGRLTLRNQFFDEFTGFGFSRYFRFSLNSIGGDGSKIELRGLTGDLSFKLLSTFESVLHESGLQDVNTLSLKDRQAGDYIIEVNDLLGNGSTFDLVIDTNTGGPSTVLDAGLEGNVATAHEDFVNPPGTIRVPAGETQVLLPIYPLADSIDEGNKEILQVAVAAGAGYEVTQVADQAAATVEIVDDDEAGFEVANHVEIFASDVFVDTGAEAQVLVPVDGSLGTLWTGGAQTFDDSAWKTAKTGIGYDEPPTPDPGSDIPGGDGVEMVTTSAPFATSLLAAYDANSAQLADDGARVVGWVDQSRNENNAFNAESTNAPTLKKASLNGHDTLAFDSSNKEALIFQNRFEFTTSAGFSYFIVAKFDSTIGTQGLLSTTDTFTLNNWGVSGSNDQLVFVGNEINGPVAAVTPAGSIVSNEWYILTGTVHGNRVYGRRTSLGTGADVVEAAANSLNSLGWTQHLVTSIGSNRVSNFSPGGEEGEFFDGEIAELLIYGRELATDELTQVENFLSDKFGTSSGDDPPADGAITQTLFSEDFETYGAQDPAPNPLGPWTYSGPGGPSSSRTYFSLPDNGAAMNSFGWISRVDGSAITTEVPLSSLADPNAADFRLSFAHATATRNVPHDTEFSYTIGSSSGTLSFVSGGNEDDSQNFNGLTSGGHNPGGSVGKVPSRLWHVDFTGSGLTSSDTITITLKREGPTPASTSNGWTFFDDVVLTATTVPEPPQIVSLDQWAATVIDFSSQYSGGGWSAAQATGEPDTFQYADVATAWTASSANRGEEFLTFGCDVPVFASAVTIRETFANGFVTRVDLLDESDAFHTVWTGTDPSAPGAPVDFRVDFETTTYKAKGVRIFVDGNHSSDYEGVDAVQLHGQEQIDPPGSVDAPVSDVDLSFQDLGLLEFDVQTEMKNVNSSVFVRIPFTVGDPTSFDRLVLQMKYDDGFVAYLNGQEVARRNLTGLAAYNSVADRKRANIDAIQFEDIDISAHLSQLKAGNNILAIHGLNATKDDEDFLLIPRLTASASTPSDSFFTSTLTPLVTEERAIIKETLTADEGFGLVSTPVYGGSTSKTVGIRLSSQPTADVSLDLTNRDMSEGSIDTNILFFTPQNWDTFQLVTITGQDDSVVDGDIEYEIQAKVNNSRDREYVNRAVTIPVLSLDSHNDFVETLDNVKEDLQGEDPTDVSSDRPYALLKPPVVVNPTGLDCLAMAGQTCINEGNTATFQVELQEPAGPNGTMVFYSVAGGTAIPGNDFVVRNAQFLRYINADEIVDFPDTPVIISENYPFQNVDVGTNAAPAFVDIDGDGDLDAFIGRKNGIDYYRNTGTRFKPNFEKTIGAGHPLNELTSTPDFFDLVPSFVDIDGDNDFDAFIGNRDDILFYENVGKADAPQFVERFNGANPLVSARSDSRVRYAPSFADLDGDGDFDAFIGDNTTAIRYYENIGDLTDPLFQFQSSANPFTAIQSSSWNDGSVFPSFSDLDQDGDLDAFVSSGDRIFAHRNDGSVSVPSFSSDLFVSNLPSGFLDAAAVFADIDSDGDDDLFVADANGMVASFERILAALIPAGQTRASIEVVTIQDSAYELFPDFGEANERIEVTLNKGAGYRLTSSNDVPDYVQTLPIIDDDELGILVTSESVGTSTTSEAGGADIYSIRLRGQPTDPVQVFLGSTDASEGQLAIATTEMAGGTPTLTPLSDFIGLNFTRENWNVPQTIHVVGVDDDVDDGNLPYKVVFSVVSDDADYHELETQTFFGPASFPINDLVLTNIDNDSANVLVTQSGLIQTAEGRENLYGVSLQSRPLGEIRVTMTPTNRQIRLENEDAGDALTQRFNPTNWNVPQVVRVSAIDDSIVEYFHTSQIDFQVDSGQLRTRDSIAVNTSARQAIDLGEVRGGIERTGLSFDHFQIIAEDDFNGDNPNNLWLSINPATTDPVHPSLLDFFTDTDGKALVFVGPDCTFCPTRHMRFAETNGLNVSMGGTVSFDLIFSDGTNGGFDVTNGEDVVLEYWNINGSGYKEIQRYKADDFTSWTTIVEPIPADAVSAGTRFRWRQVDHDGYDLDQWGLDNVRISGRREEWYQFTLPDAATTTDVVSGHFDGTSDASIRLYDSDVFSPIDAISPDDQGNWKLNLDGHPAGQYFLQILPRSTPLRSSYSIALADEDSKYQDFSVTPLEVLIQDNDIPTARIVAGPTASEVFSEPSYFAIELNAPAPQEIGDTGIVVHYEISGGSASLRGSTEGNDYFIGSDNFAESTKRGSVRIGPGEIQGNIIVVPVDDKVVEDLRLEITSTSANHALEAPVATSDVTWPGLPASFLTDGNLGTVTHPNGPTPAGYYYEVDLGAIIELDHIDIYGRTGGCCPERLSNYRVQVLDANRASVWSGDFRTDGSNPGVDGRDTITASMGVGTFTGQFIRVSNRGGENYFPQMAELEAYGSEFALQVETKVRKRTGDTTNLQPPKVLKNSQLTIQTGDGEVVATILNDTLTLAEILPRTVEGNFEIITFGGTLNVKVDQNDIGRLSGVVIPPDKPLIGRITEESVTVRLLPDPQLDPLTSQPSPSYQVDSDANDREASLGIFDDDVPGIRIVEMGEHTTVREGESTTFQISLLSEPQSPVTITLTPGAEVDFNDATSSSVVIEQPVYQFQLADDAPLGLELESFVETDQGFAVTFNAKLESAPAALVSTGNPNIDMTNSFVNVTFSDANAVGATPEVSLKFKRPGTDLAGLPTEGTWNVAQQLTLSNLTRDGQGNFNLRAASHDPQNQASQTVEFGIQVAPVPRMLDKKTTSITIQPERWYELETVTVFGSDDAVAEPGVFHTSFISYEVKTELTQEGIKDAAYDGLFVPDQTIHVLDRVLDAAETADAIFVGLSTLDDSLGSLSIPLVGNLDGIAPDVIGDFNQGLSNEVSAQDNLTALKLKGIIENVLGKVGLDAVTVSADVTEDDIMVLLDFSKSYPIFSLPLSADLGLPALGIGFETVGSITSTFDIAMSLGFGLHKDFGFYIDTENTGIEAGLRLNLDSFKGAGHLGFLQLDFADDPDNPTELAITFEAGLNDLDNYQTIQFFDVDGDALLDADEAFSFDTKTDKNPKDFKADIDDEGEFITKTREVLEPFANVNNKGIAEDFPLVSEAVAAAKRVNWNGNNTFDEAEFNRNEGVYRTKEDGTNTIIYFDSNRNGKLDIAQRNHNPFTQPWTGLTNKNGSELWVNITDSNKSRLLDAKGNVKPFTILQDPAGKVTVDTKFYFDADKDTIRDANEEISGRLKKKFDKNKNLTLDADVVREPEGQFVQGIGIAFADTVKDNGKLDVGETYVLSNFDSLVLEEDGLIGGDMPFLDFNGDGKLTLDDDDDPDELLVRVVTTGDDAGVRFLDVNANGLLDDGEPRADSEADPLAIPDEYTDDMNMELPFVVTHAILTVNGIRFIDQDDDGEFDDGSDPVDRDTQINAAIAERLGIADVDSEITFLDGVSTDHDNPDGRLSISAGFIEPLVLVQDGVQFVDLDWNKELTLDDDDNPLEPIAGPNNEFETDDLEGPIVEFLDDGDRLTLTELINFQKDPDLGFADLFTFSFAGEANLGLKTKTSVNGNSAFPSFSFDLAVGLPLFNYGDEDDADDQGLTVDFNNLTLELGTFLSDFVQPIVSTVDTLLTPVKPVVEALNADTKLLSYIGLESAFDADGKPGVSVLDIAKTLFAGSDPRIDTAIKFADTLTTIVDVVNTLSSLTAGSNVAIEFGDFSLDDLKAASDDEANSTSQVRDTRGQMAQSDPLDMTQATPAAERDAKAKNSTLKDKYNKMKELEGFEIPIITNPVTAVRLLLGEKDVDLITYDIPDIDFGIELNKSFPIFGPIQGVLEGSFNISTDLAVGYDTHGLEAWKADDFSLASSYKVLDGFFLNDWDEDDGEKDEFSLDARIAAGVAASAVVVKAEVKGGIEAGVGLDIVDVGERSEMSDGKIRGSEVFSRITTPLELFQLSGKLEAFLNATVKMGVDFGFFEVMTTVWEKDFARFKIAEFTVGAKGSNFTSDVGRLNNGYIQGATIWFDADNNGVLDPGEPNTVTDVEGNFSLIIPDTFDRSAGIIRAQGGIDVTTGLPMMTTLTALPDEHEDITPLTTLIHHLVEGDAEAIDAVDINDDGIVDDADNRAFILAFADQLPVADINGDQVFDEVDVDEFLILWKLRQFLTPLTPDEAHDLLQDVFGIDADVDLGDFDHIAEALDGNPVAEETLRAINAVQAVVTELHELLTGAAGVAFDDPVVNAAVSTAIYTAIADEIRATGRLDLSNRDQLREILLLATLEVGRVAQRNNLVLTIPSDLIDQLADEVVEILATSTMIGQMLADDAQDGVDLVTRETQAKKVIDGEIAPDLHLVGMGQLPIEVAMERHGHADEATLEKIRQVLLPPDAGQITNFELFENDAISDYAFHVFDFETPAEELIVTALSDNQALLPTSHITITQGESPRQRLISFAPTANQAGLATVTVTVTDSDGLEIHEDFTVRVFALNDAPVAFDDNVEAFTHEPIVIDVLENDFDVDGDRLSASVVTGVSHGTLIQSAAGTFRYTSARDFVGNDSFTYQVNDGHNGIATATVSISVAPDTGELVVQSFTPTESGFIVQFDRPFDASVLNLAELGMDGNEPEDVTLIRDAATGPIDGSFILSPQSLTFVATGDPLPPDRYQLTLRSAADGFYAVGTGVLLDGNDDGIPGDDFVATFVVEPTEARIVGLPDVSRGPGEIVADPSGSIGLPVHIDDASGVRLVEMTLRFDAKKVRIGDVEIGSDLPAQSRLRYRETTPGVLTVVLNSPTPLPAGPAELLNLVVIVSPTVSYGDKQVLDITEILLNQGDTGVINALADDAVHVAARQGDFNSDGVFNAADINNLFRSIRSGRTLVDSDLNGNGIVDQFDVNFLVENLIGTFMGDADLDGEVGTKDLNAIALNWRSEDAEGWEQGDFDGDGKVSAADLDILALNWKVGTTASATTPLHHQRTPRAPLPNAGQQMFAAALPQQTTHPLSSHESETEPDPVRSITSQRSVDVVRTDIDMPPRQRNWQRRDLNDHPARASANETQSDEPHLDKIDEFFAQEVYSLKTTWV